MVQVAIAQLHNEGRLLWRKGCLVFETPGYGVQASEHPTEGIVWLPALFDSPSISSHTQSPASTSASHNGSSTKAHMASLLSQSSTRRSRKPFSMPRSRSTATPATAAQEACPTTPLRRPADPKQVERQLLEEEAQLDQKIKTLHETYNETELDALIIHLHEYNDIKDLGQQLLGVLARMKGTTTREMYDEFGLDLDD
eukprot:m.158410 g.158410  ORF g.158410 m.158410 type:complete len:198 (+) comp17601_c0_seq1:1540-2133(+)